jgi:hypothetical protein
MDTYLVNTERWCAVWVASVVEIKIESETFTNVKSESEKNNFRF